MASLESDEPSSGDDLVDRYGDPLFGEPLPPRCGWLAPDGRFVACIPWEHTEKAYDIATALGLPEPTGGDGANDVLFREGWVKVARRDRGDHRRLGGRFRFESPKLAFASRVEALASLTHAQADVEAAWMALDAVDLDEAP